MRPNRLDTSVVFEPSTPRGVERVLSLPASSVHLRPTGVEFLSHKPLPLWKEMTVEIEGGKARRARCTGVVVASNGNRHSGYVVSMVFMRLSRQAQQALNLMARL